MQYEGIKQSNKVILMKLTSRERPEVLLDTVSRYIQLAANTKDMVWLFSFDEDDVCSSDEFKSRIFEKVPNAFIVVGRSENKIHAINRDVNDFREHWDILLNISDDQIPNVKGYDDYIRRAMPDHLDASLWFHDGAQDRINTQEILGRVYYERDKFIYDPRFKSFYCDNLATRIAQERGKMIQSKVCIIKHQHPACKGTVPDDQLYKRNNKYWSEDKKMFNQIVMYRKYTV